MDSIKRFPRKLKKQIKKDAVYRNGWQKYTQCRIYHLSDIYFAVHQYKVGKMICPKKLGKYQKERN